MNKIRNFLKAAGWSDAQEQPIAGDASARQYLRLERKGGETAVLMIAPPDGQEDLERFRVISRWLLANGLGPPKELYHEAEQGLLLLEDLGDSLFSRCLNDRSERDLYDLATEVLLHVATLSPLQDLKAPSWIEMAEAVVEPLSWYPGVDTSVAEEMKSAVVELLEGLNTQSRVFSFRDYHVENLVLRSERSGLLRAGLLDFQDAFLVPPAYDLASLLRDARHTVSESLRTRTIERFATATGMLPDALDHDVAVFSVQRNLRILFVFARLIRRDGKSKYKSFVPHVRRMIDEDLDRLNAHPLKLRLTQTVPSHDTWL